MVKLYAVLVAPDVDAGRGPLGRFASVPRFLDGLGYAGQGYG